MIKLAKPLFIIIPFTGLILIYFRLAATCAEIRCLVSPGKGRWETDQVYSKSDKSWKGMLNAPGYKVRLEKVGGLDQATASELTKTNLMRIQGLFDKARSPYPGAISDEIECPREFKPKEEVFKSTHGMDIHYLKSYLNNRMQYGSCIESENEWISFIGSFYCANTNEWYMLEFIAPKEKVNEEKSYKEILAGMYCQRPSLKTGKLLP